jgi:hypothetical protein
MPHPRGTTWRVAAAALGLMACSCERAWPGAAAPAAAPTPDPGYRSAPALLGLSRGADGLVSLKGRAAPSAQVRLVSPAGSRIETAADGAGAWTAPLGPAPQPVLYGLSAQSQGRRVQAEGYVAVLPGAPTVALLRAGAGAQAMDPGSANPGGLRILAVDLDGAGAVVVSGRAAPNAPVTILLDGAAAMEGRAEGDGRFSLALPKPAAPGLHRLEARTASHTSQVAVSLTPPASPALGPYHVTHGGVGWRVDWITPGGGPQTTFLVSDARPGQ